MKIPFDIFIGGPMGNDKLDAAGDSYHTHIPNIVSALERIRDEIASSASSIYIRILHPNYKGSGMINDNVFSMINDAELAIMDVSAGSPNVMYELAMLHALGTPTIPVLLGDANGKPIHSQKGRKIHERAVLPGRLLFCCGPEF